MFRYPHNIYYAFPPSLLSSLKDFDAACLQPRHFSMQNIENTHVNISPLKKKSTIRILLSHSLPSYGLEIP